MLAVAGTAGYLRSAVRDRAELEKAIADFVALAKKDPLKKRLKELSLRISSGKTKVDGVASTRLRPHDARSHFHLWTALERLGDLGACEAAYRAAIHQQRKMHT